MSSIAPIISDLEKSTCFINRKVAKGIFLRRHDSPTNKELVHSELAELKVVSNPGEWFFLVEGNDSYATAENNHLREIESAYGLKVEDPIVLPFTAQIATESGIPSEEAALAVLFYEYLGLLEETIEINEQNLQSFFSFKLPKVAEKFDIANEDLETLFREMDWGNIQTFWQRITALKKVRERLIERSNIKSRIRLAELLVTNVESNIFAIAGVEHIPVFSN